MHSATTDTCSMSFTCSCSSTLGEKKHLLLGWLSGGKSVHITCFHFVASVAGGLEAASCTGGPIEMVRTWCISNVVLYFYRCTVGVYVYVFVRVICSVTTMICELLVRGPSTFRLERVLHTKYARLHAGCIPPWELLSWVLLPL